MEFPECYHIGLPKTGSTSLQDIIRKDSRVRMIEKTRYFNTDRWYQDAYPDMASERPTIESDEAIIREYAGRSGHRTALERIQRCRPDARIVLFLREQSGILLSAYKHHIRVYYDPYDLGDYLKSPAGISFRNMIQYDRLLSDVLSFFPKERVHVFFYEEIKASPERFLERFYQEVFGLSAPELPMGSKNKGVSASRIRLKRSLNALKIFKQGSWAAPLDRVFIKAAYKSFRGLVKEKHSDRDFLEECPYFRDILEEFARSNRKALDLMELPLREYGYELE